MVGVASDALGLGSLLRFLLLLLLLLPAALVSAVGSVLRGFAGAAPVVGRVEAGALEVDRHRIEDALEWPLAADLALLGRGLVDPLEELEQMPVRATVFVDWHYTE